MSKKNIFKNRSKLYNPFCLPRSVCRDTNTEVFAPEMWAAESINILEANMVAANLVHRDFENLISQQGDVVNTRKPAAFTAIRKIDSESVTRQTAQATNIAVPLDQHFHTSFIIKDGEESKGFMSLVDFYLRPGIQSIAQEIDRVILGQVYQFLPNRVGKLQGGMSLANITDAKETLSTNKCPDAGRNMIITPAAENDLLQISTFTEAEKIGDQGTVLREGSLGRRLGFNFNVCQNAPQISLTNQNTKTNAVNLTAGYAAGTTSIETDGAGSPVAGEWCTIAGDMTPQFIVSRNTAGTMVISPGLASAVVNDAVITTYDAGALNKTAGYDSGYSLALVVDGFTNAVKANQLISYGTTVSTRKIHSAIGTPTTIEIWLDRPTEAALVNDAVIAQGPAGAYNFAFHRNAIALVTRPLALPRPGTGALSGVGNYNGLSIRIVITYDGDAQGHLVTADILCGVKVLDTDLGCVVLS